MNETFHLHCEKKNNPAEEIAIWKMQVRCKKHLSIKEGY